MRNRQGRKKNADINLLPMIDILAVCITFLLTAVAVKVGSFELNQAMGIATEEKVEDKPTLWVEFKSNDLVLFEVKLGKRVLARSSSKSAPQDIEKIAQSYRRQNPDLKTAMILPSANSKYSDLIDVMDGLKKNEITQIGIAPL